MSSYSPNDSSKLVGRLQIFEEKLYRCTRPLVMGILNRTPDSFSDGGKHQSLEFALESAQQMIELGADIVDIGGESTRPGAPEVSVAEELDRVLPLVQKCHEFDIPVSIDTMKIEVMKACTDIGIVMLNDVNGFQAQGSFEYLSSLSNPSIQPFLCVMHMQGTPRSMQHQPSYNDLIGELMIFFKERIDFFHQAGIISGRVVVDPGFGFGKTDDHNWMLLKELNCFNALNCPILAGLSRKSMFGRLLGKDPMDRIPASLAAALIAAQNGARIIRVHDVAETLDVLKVLEASY